MRIEALQPLSFCLPDGRRIDMYPGQPVDLPDETAAWLMAKVPEKVRSLPAAPVLTPEEVREHNARAREEGDTYWTGIVLPALTRLYAEGKIRNPGRSRVGAG